jgi:HEAT repeat protein
MLRLVRWLPVVLYAFLLSAAGRAGTNGQQVAEDEALLKSAGVVADERGLREFFVKLTPSKEDQKRLGALIDLLANDSFRVREKAVADLIAAGPVALPLLSRASQDADLETRRRAEQCIHGIERRFSPAVVAAAVRLMPIRRPTDACAVLLAYLPFAGAEIEEEVLGAVLALGSRDGKIDTAVLTGLKDQLPVRRAAAALVLGRLGDAAQQAEVRKLLMEADPTVRLRAAQGLLAARDKAALPILIDLLQSGTTQVAQTAEDLLRNVAGDRAPTVFLGEADATRAKARQTWAAWYNVHGAELDLASAEAIVPLASASLRVRQISRRFLLALADGDLDLLTKLTEVPFTICGVATFAQRDQLTQIFQESGAKQQRAQMVFTVTKVGGLAEYTKTADDRERSFLKGLPQADVRIAYIRGREVSGKVESATLIVRVTRTQARIIGIGSPRPAGK